MILIDFATDSFGILASADRLPLIRDEVQSRFLGPWKACNQSPLSIPGKTNSEQNNG